MFPAPFVIVGLLSFFSSVKLGVKERDLLFEELPEGLVGVPGEFEAVLAADDAALELGELTLVRSETKVWPKTPVWPMYIM